MARGIDLHLLEMLVRVDPAVAPCLEVVADAALREARRQGHEPTRDGLMSMMKSIMRVIQRGGRGR